jgi:sugar phosphate isomerase/epimerase
MLSVGIINGYFPYSLDEQIRRIKEAGFSCVQLELIFKDLDTSMGSLSKATCQKIRNAFRDANIPIVAISAYNNIIQSNLAKRRDNIAALKTIIGFARDLGTTYVVSESGTYNASSDWIPDPKNDSEEGYEEALTVIKDIVNYSYNCGVTFVLENYVNHIIGSVEQVLRLFADVNHKSLGLLMDPCNYFTGSTIDHVDNHLNKMFDSLGERILFAHAKDCKRAKETSEKVGKDEAHSFLGAGDVELPAPGHGVLNYDLYLKRLHKVCPNMPVIIEHLQTESDIARAKKFVDGKLREAGC